MKAWLRLSRPFLKCRGPGKDFPALSVLRQWKVTKNLRRPPGSRISRPLGEGGIVRFQIDHLETLFLSSDFNPFDDRSADKGDRNPP